LNGSRRGSSACIGRCASTPSSIAARRKSPASCSVSIAAAAREATVAYLREREQVTSVYLETTRRITLAGTPQRDVSALVYVVDRSHPQYAGRLDLERQVHLVRQGHGRSGANRDYVLSTVAEIEAQGCHDSSLHAIAERLKGGHDVHA
jgi:glutathione-specific gamma-glutamylcyclotransferase